MDQLQKGDQVTLKSGGPSMTVKHKMADGTWQCSWFAKDELREGFFTEEQLIVWKERTN